MPDALGARPYRLLLTADTVGGVWRYALDLARGSSEAGCEVTLATLGPSASEAQRREAASINGLELIETGEPLDWLCNVPRDVERTAATVAELSRRADLVQLNGTALGGLARFAAPVVAMHHSCLATWWSAVRQSPPPQEWAWRIEYTREHLHSAASVAAPSAAFAEATAKTYGLCAPPRVIANGRPWPNEQTNGPPADALLTAGRLWDEGKNIRALDRAASRIHAPIYAAGPLRGPNGAEIELQTALSLGALSETEMRVRFSERPIFVSTALYEPFGLAVLEAAQAGCALVLSDIATFRELWGGAAVFVDPADPDALAAAANQLLADAKARAALGEDARERARRYSAQASLDATLAWHRAILARAAHRESAA